MASAPPARCTLWLAPAVTNVGGGAVFDGTDTVPTEVGLKVVGAGGAGGGADAAPVGPGGGAGRPEDAPAGGGGGAWEAFQVLDGAGGAGGGALPTGGGGTLAVPAGGPGVTAVTGQTVVLTGMMTVVATVLWAGQLLTSGPQLVMVWVVVL